MTRIAYPYIIDLEASGFGQQGYPIEVGLAMEPGNCYCSLIAPAQDWAFWDESAEQLHHISREILERHGRPPEKIALELNQLLKGKTIYTDGWVVDNSWIIQLFHIAGIEKQFTVSSLEYILSEDQIAIWDRTKKHLQREMNITRHRASNDALIVQETYLKTLVQTV